MPSPAPAGTELGPADCRELRILDSSLLYDSLTWVTRPDPELEPWCRVVGPALAYRPETGFAPVNLPDLTVVTWNVHGGGGDVDSLVADLRSGRLDGRATDSFVLLLQEVFRAGASVPADWASEARFGKRVAPEETGRDAQSIEAVARRNGLHLLYVPSVRNGGPGDPPEDRGNAILSSLPLTSMEAFELPLEKERRVALASRIAVVGEGGEPTTALLVNLHLDVRSQWSSFHRTLGAGRADQARSIAEYYGGEAIVVGGGDLNTWVGGNEEEAVRILQEVFPEPELRSDSRTVQPLGPLSGFVVDHLFFRLPATLTGNYSVVQDRYGSDHYPVIGWIAETPGEEGGSPPVPGREFRP